MNGHSLGHSLTLTKKTKTFDIIKFLNQKKVQRALYKVSAGLLIIALIALGGLSYARAYSGKIFPKITLAGVKVGGLAPSDAQKLLDEKTQVLNSNGPEITYNDQILKPKLDEMGITFNTKEIIDSAYHFGRQGDLKQRILENYQIYLTGHQMETKPQIDEAKFDAYLGQLAAVIEKEPVNASLKVANGQIELIPAQNGRGLDKTKLKNDLTALINSGQTSGKIVTSTSDLKPAINEDGTLKAASQAEKYLSSAPITVTFENSAWTADGSEIGSWIKFSENADQLAASIHPTAFINYIAKQVEIPAVDREIEDGTGTVLKEGQDGRGVDTNTLAAQINETLGNAKPASFALFTFAVPRADKIIFPHAQPGRYAGRYIDINLSEQTLYAFEGPTLVNQFLVSTGKRGYSTPTGEFSVYGKDRSTLMDGPDYYLPNVQWVSWFLGDYSIHGTYWHSNFGNVMSHGCVNASNGDAEWLYGWDEIGTPVYVHY